MTTINVISSIIYTRGAPLREKIQTNFLALVFLVILYNSPSGLVFYWILNNIFSLVKNIVKKSARPAMLVHRIFSICLVLLCLFLVLFKDEKFSLKKIVFYLLTAGFVFAPMVRRKLGKNFERIKTSLRNLFANTTMFVTEKQGLALFVASCSVLWLLCGLVLPASVVATSPSEFSFLGNTDSPLSYVWSSLLFFAGLFVFWPLVVHRMFSGNEKVKKAMPPLFFVVAVCAVANAFLFKYNYGTVNVLFRLDDTSVLYNRSAFFVLLPIVFMAIVMFLFVSAVKAKRTALLTTALVALCLGELSLGAVKAKKIKDGFDIFARERKTTTVSQSAGGKIEPQFHFSKEKENVVVLILDRAISSFFPYILEQFPELGNSYDGFVFYPNCLSFADFTNCGVPALLGGYDYSIDEINKRDDTLLKDKHNEALLLMPMLFNEAGFATTMYNPPYVNYYESPIPTDFDITKIIPRSTFLADKYRRNFDTSLINDLDYYSSIRHFSVMQTLYPPMRSFFSNRTAYYIVIKGNSVNWFMDAYAELFYLNENFDTEAQNSTFTVIYNLTTHEYTTLCEGYVPFKIDDEHPAAGTGSYKYIDGPETGGDNDFQAYHVNAAAHLQIGKFLNALKEKGIYDNTRIIIVADHGRGIRLPIFNGFEHWEDAAFLNPLLLFKDFGAHGKPVTDNSFTTNAETVHLAIKNLPVSNKNPFTGNTIRKASEFDFFNVYRIREWRISEYKDKTRFPIKWKSAYTVRDNIFDKNNWTKIDTSKAEE